MTTRANGSGGDCAPGPTPTGVYRPGDVVRWRVPFGTLAGEQSRPVYPVFVIDEVAHITSVLGSRVRYCVMVANSRHWVSPAHVVRIGPGDPPEPPAAAPVVVPPEPPAPVPVAVIEPVTAAPSSPKIVWEPKPNAPHGSVGAGGRFEVDQPVAGTFRFDARDRWTGERVTGLTVLASATKWCEARLDTRPLEWDADRTGWASKHPHDGTTLRVQKSTHDTPGFYGVDCRFRTDHPLRHSPIFAQAEDAQHWCAIRAACRLTGEGADLALSYAGPIPF